MDQINRIQEMEGIQRSGTSKNFVQESLKQSVDLPAYITWQTLSTDVSEKLRQGSVRINRSNVVEWAAIDEGEADEKSNLLDQIVSRQRKTPTDSNGGASSGSSSTTSFTYNNQSGNGSGGFHPTPQQIPSYAATESDINANVKHSKSSASNWKVGVFLLVNTALGAGVLNYPAAYHRLGGIPLSTALQLVIILLIASTMLVLIFCADLHNDTTYHDVLRSMCGKRAQQFAASSIMCTCFGINVTFLIIIGDQFDRLLLTFVGPDFCQTSFFLHRKFTISMIAVLLIWPCCYFKRLDFLRYVSTLGIFAMIYVVFLNVYEYYKLDVIPGEIKTRPNNAISVVAALPVIFFAYQSHEIVLPIYSCLEKPRTTNFIKSTVLSLSLLFVIYSLAGSYGYLTFGANVAADIIQSYDARDPVVVAGIFALIIKMVSTYPPLMFCGRGALDGLYAEWRRLTTEDYINGERCRRVVITTFWNTFVLMLAVVTPNITIAIEMLGSLAACNVFIFPGLCMVSLARRHLIGYYSKIAYERRLLRSLEGTARWNQIWTALVVYGLIIILFGMAMFIIVILQVISEIVRLSSGSEAGNEFGC